MDGRFLRADNACQLDICLRMLYAECVEYNVVLRERDDGELFYVVHIDSLDASNRTFDELSRLYSYLTK